MECPTRTAKAASAGAGSVLAFGANASGQLFSFGSNEFGQLGTAANAGTKTPHESDLGMRTELRGRYEASPIRNREARSPEPHLA